MTVNIHIPKTWNELTTRQLQEIAYIIEYYHGQASARKESAAFYVRFYFQLIKQLLRNNNWFKIMIAIRQVPPSEYKAHVTFLLGQVQRTNFPTAVKINGTIYHPPADRLKNISIKEFSFADAMFYNWREKGDDRYLDLLCAALYRPKGGNALDVREPFNKLLVENHVKNFAKLNYKKKLAIAYAYTGSRNYIASLYPNVFPKPAKVDPEETEKPRKSEYVPFGKLIQHKIQYDPSKLERTQNLNVNEFLSTYENELSELKKVKK